MVADYEDGERLYFHGRDEEESFELRSALKYALKDKAGLIIGILMGIITAALLRFLL